MKFLRRDRRDDPGIDMAPLIDVVFLLLIFFMVTTTFNKQSELKIVLPKAQSSEAVKPQNPLTLTIDRHGNYYLNGRELVNTRPDTLFRALQEAKASKGGKVPLIVRADANTPYQSVVTAMDVAGQLGLSRLSIATDKPAPTR
jgi:biopolymer transport protein ExbD